MVSQLKNMENPRYNVNELFSVHEYLETFGEIFEQAGIPIIRYGIRSKDTTICGSRGFIFADCNVSRTESRARIMEIITGKDVKVSFSTTRYSTLYSGVRWLWPIRSRGMGSISCFYGSKRG